MTEKLERILIINDDTEDVLAIKARLPEEIEIEAASQIGARMMEHIFGYDLVILDNDANDLKKSKGMKTLQEVRKGDQEVPVLYTSFQPGWVDGSVFQTRGVEVVRTDELVDRIAERFSVDVSAPVVAERPEPETNIILTYNDVRGYQPGIYGNGKLLIVSYDKAAGIRAKEVLAGHVGQIYGSFDWRADRDLVQNIFVYDGINGEHMPGSVAQALGHDVRMKVNLMACLCDWDRKQSLQNSSYVNLTRVGCGGSWELGAVADTILGVKRADPTPLPMPVEQILGKAERMRL